VHFVLQATRRLSGSLPYLPGCAVHMRGARQDAARLWPLERRSRTRRRVRVTWMRHTRGVSRRQQCNHAQPPLTHKAGAQARRARAAAARYDRNMSNTRRDSPDSSANVYSDASAACAAANAASLAGGTCTPTSSTVERLPAARPRRNPCQLCNVSAFESCMPRCQRVLGTGGTATTPSACMTPETHMHTALSSHKTSAHAPPPRA